MNDTTDYSHLQQVGGSMKRIEETVRKAFRPDNEIPAESLRAQWDRLGQEITDLEELVQRLFEKTNDVLRTDYGAEDDSDDDIPGADSAFGRSVQNAWVELERQNRLLRQLLRRLDV